MDIASDCAGHEILALPPKRRDGGNATTGMSHFFVW